MKKTKKELKLQLSKTESLMWRLLQGLNSERKAHADAIWAQVRDLNEQARHIEKEINQSALESLAIIGENHGQEIPDSALIKFGPDGYEITFEA